MLGDESVENLPDSRVVHVEAVDPILNAAIRTISHNSAAFWIQSEIERDLQVTVVLLKGHFGDFELRYSRVQQITAADHCSGVGDPDHPTIGGPAISETVRDGIQNIGNGCGAKLNGNSLLEGSRVDVVDSNANVLCWPNSSRASIMLRSWTSKTAT